MIVKIQNNCMKLLSSICVVNSQYKIFTYSFLIAGIKNL